MSERYGSPDELQEAFEDLERWLEEELDKARNVLPPAATSVWQAQYTAGRIDTLRDVLDFILNRNGQ